MKLMNENDTINQNYCNLSWKEKLMKRGMFLVGLGYWGKWSNPETETIPRLRLRLPGHLHKPITVRR